ncbi:MAG: hypothetical protein DIU72_008435 [Pseudomonadota bacterium]|nr:MAG: hypothetical protein DIU72_10095 [Pseudomonadota bacterium]
MLEELVDALARAVAERVPLLIGASLVGGALMWAEGKRLRWGWIGGPLALVGSLVHAWSMRWLADDAFISFRYAKNWAAGLGPVFNPGEWVEGYTNFLWTAALALAARLGASIPHVAFFGNLLGLAVAVGGTAWTVWRLVPGARLPFAALALAGCSGFAEFGTSGLETMILAATVVVGMAASLGRTAAWPSGLAFCLAVFLRPDALLLWGAFGLAMVGEDLVHGDEASPWRRLRLRRYLAYAAPFLLLFPPYWAWRWATYGTFLPHTFSVKVVGPYWEQGAFYVAHAVLSSGGWAWLPALAVALAAPGAERGETRIRLFAAIALPVFSAYLAYVGGDFMEYRFFVPLFPIAFLAAELGIRRALAGASSRRRPLLVGLALVAFAAVVVPTRLIGSREQRWHLTAEHTVYRVVSLFPLEIDSVNWELGKKYARLFREAGIAPRFAASAVGMVGYLTDLPLVDGHGLTNRRIGSMPVKKRGRPGHERLADIEALLAEGVVLTRDFYWPSEILPLSLGEVDGVPLLFVRYDPEVFRALERFPGAVLPNPEEDLRQILSEDPPLPILGLVHSFYSFFLHGHPDREALLRQIEAKMAGARGSNEQAVR